MIDRCLCFIEYKLYLGKEACRDEITNLAIQIIKLFNQCADRSLAYKLHDLADQYDPRPESCDSDCVNCQFRV